MTPEPRKVQINLEQFSWGALIFFMLAGFNSSAAAAFAILIGCREIADAIKSRGNTP